MKLMLPWISMLILLDAPAARIGAHQVTFYANVLPILQKHCQACHRPGEIGPMPLETYRQVRPWAKAIRQAVLLKKMPPWFANPCCGKFANDPTLKAGEIAAIRSWVDGVALAGSPRDARPARQWPSGWNITQPDTVFGVSKPFPIPPSGTVEYQYIVLPTGFREDKWVRMAEVRPTDRSVVHHAVVYIRPPGSAWLKEAKPGIPYSIPEDDPRHRTLWTTSDILLVYAPGNPPDRLAPGQAKLIPAGSDLVLQMHYTPNGKATSDQTRIGLVFAKEPVKSRVLTLQMGNDRFVIPPGHPHYRVAVEGTLPNAATLLSLFPHMHLRGSSFAFNYIHPDGKVEKLLEVDHYDFHWQISYRLAEPRPLPAGAKLEWVAYYDNSSNNPSNPDPGIAVHYGEQSWEEMMIGFFDVAVAADIDKARFFVRPEGALVQ